MEKLIKMKIMFKHWTI